MAMSGIVVSDECMSAHEQLKVKHSLRYIIFNIEKVDKCGKKEDTIVVQKTVTRDDAELWKDFCEEFPEDDCRYALFDLPLKTKDNQATDKLLMIYWTGSSATIKRKMITSSSLATLKTKLAPDAFAQVDDRKELLDIAELVKDNKQLSKFTFDEPRLAEKK